jgi:hypothetical protein
MAQNKKKRKKPPQRAPIKYDSKAYNDRAYAAIRKVLQVYGFDPGLLDAFTKQQRRFLVYVMSEPLHFKVEEGHYVPRQLVNFVAESTQRFLRTHYFGDESIGLTYLELATFGMAFHVAVLAEHINRFFLPKQLKIIDDLAACFENERIRNDLAEVGTHIRKLMMMISKVNFRLYGFDWKIWIQYEGKRECIKSEVCLSSENPKAISFTYKQKDRRAFSVRAGRIIATPTTDAQIDRWFVTFDDSEPAVYLNIYIQSHALQRVKERLDIFPAHVRNYYVMEPLLYMHRVTDTQARSPMLECYTSFGSTIVRFGYYPFIIQNDTLIVLTFLPLVSSKTPEGKQLNKLLGLQRADTMFLGMDKLSFFCTVDFEQIPVLKQAMVDTGIWNLIEYAAQHPDVNCTIDQKKTQMVKKFFEKKIDILNEIAGLEGTVF